MTKDTLVFTVSQSGETIDTLAALRESKRKGYRTLGICNSVGSTIARESDGGVYMHAGPEIGVAATKSFTSQVVVLTLLAFLLGRIRHLSSSQGIEIISAMESVPELARQVLEQSDAIEKLAGKYANAAGFLFFGRQYNYPIALEGALKLKEITYKFAEGHPSAYSLHCWAGPLGCAFCHLEQRLSIPVPRRRVTGASRPVSLHCCDGSSNFLWRLLRVALGTLFEENTPHFPNGLGMIHCPAP